MAGCDIVTDSTTKAKLLNDQRAFSKSVPIKHKHIAEQATNGQASGGCYPSMPPINITVAGVEKLLNKLNPYKAPGPDNVQPRILRELSCQISPVLCNIFKVSLRTDTVPDDWKLANVTPIHKKGSRQLPENYRPVSLSCIYLYILAN